MLPKLFHFERLHKFQEVICLTCSVNGFRETEIKMRLSLSLRPTFLCIYATLIGNNLQSSKTDQVIVYPCIGACCLELDTKITDKIRMENLGNIATTEGAIHKA